MAVRPVDEGRMSLVEHLRELRNRLAVSLVAVAIGVVVAWFFYQHLYDFLKRPYCQVPKIKNCDLYALNIFDQFRARLRLSFLGGTIAAAPVWLYEIGAFITPALHRRERRYALAFLAASMLLFVAGGTFAYLTVSRGLAFFLQAGGNGIVQITTVQSYLSFVTLMLLAFGVAFEFPVVLMFLNLVGVMPADRMRGWWRGMVMGIFVASAVITPTQDPFSFLAMALPLCGLYGVCILIATGRERRHRRRLAADPLRQLDDDQASVVASPTDEAAAADSEPSRL